MNEADFLRLLNSIRFAERYWSLCDAFKSASLDRSMTQSAIRGAFALTDLRPRFKGRIAIASLGDAAGFAWEARIVPKRTGYLELSIYGLVGDEYGLGGGFQGLALRSKQLADPAFARTPPYPAPDPGGDPDALNTIIAEFARLVRDVFSSVERIGGRA